MKSSVFDNGVVELSILQSELAACRDVDDLHDAACGGGGGGGACDGGLDMNSTSSSSSSSSDQLLPGSDDMSNCSPVDSCSKQDSFDVVQVDDVVNDIVMVRDGAVDFRGRPSVKSRTGNWRACWIIFGCEVCERIAFYAISANLVTYLTTVLHEDISVSARNVNNWSGTTFMTPLIAAFVADAYLGRYWTLATFSCGYFLALVFVTMSVSLPSLKPPKCDINRTTTTQYAATAVCPPATRTQIGFFYFALYLMALGAGGIKSCVSALAGDQFDDLDPVEAKRKKSFPNWWFVALSFGSMLSVSVFVYVQQTLGWSWGYGIPTLITGVATTAYFLNTPSYRCHPPSGSPFTRVAQVIVSALRNWRVPVLPSHAHLLHEVDDKLLLLHAGTKLLPHTNGLLGRSCCMNSCCWALHCMWGGDGDRFLDKAATVPLDYTKRSESPVYNNKKFSSNGGSSPSPAPPALAFNNNNPWRLCTVTQVEEVKLLVRMLPIWVTNLMFSVVFAQVGTLFLNQGTTLDRHVSGNFEIPAASMSFFVTFSICVCLPFYDKFFVPFVRSFTTDERGLTLLQRIGVGQVISTVSIMVAAVVEMHRLRVAQSLNSSPSSSISSSSFSSFSSSSLSSSSSSSSSLPSSVQESLPMSIFWLLPQYVLTGVCEVFISVGQMEFFLDQAPDSMRSLGSALYLSTVATGSFISSLLVSIVTKITYNENGGWIGNDLNQSHMDYFYWLLAALSIVNLAAYILCASCYTYKNNANKNFSTSELFSSAKTTTTLVTLQGPRLIAAADSSDSSGPLSPTHCITVPPPPHGIDMLPLGGYKELT